MFTNDFMTQCMLVDFRPIGSFHVYALLTEAEYRNKESYIGKVYWSDKIAATPQGPFKDVQSAINGYLKICDARRYLNTAINEPPLGELPKTIPEENNVLDLDAFRASRPRRHW